MIKIKNENEVKKFFYNGTTYIIDIKKAGSIMKNFGKILKVSQVKNTKNFLNKNNLSITNFLELVSVCWSD